MLHVEMISLDMNMQRNIQNPETRHHQELANRDRRPPLSIKSNWLCGKNQRLEFFSAFLFPVLDRNLPIDVNRIGIFLSLLLHIAHVMILVSIAIMSHITPQGANLKQAWW